MEEALARFIAANSALPWSPGGAVDCCLALAEWAIWLGYPDPAAHLRGAYKPGQGQLDILAEHGGALPLVASCAAAIDGKPVAVPETGNIGVVGSARNPLRQFGVIHDGRCWLTRTPTGWTTVSAKALGTWKI